MEVIRFAAIAIGAIGVGQITHAQDRVLDTVTVTAQKKAEDVSNVPVAISAFDGEDLTELSIGDPLDLAGQTPGLSTVMNSVGAPSFSIRGVGLEDFIGNNASGTAIYVDEIYPVSAVMQGFRLFDLERVEVLKGPQGTLYGRNSTGGAVNIITAKPGKNAEAYLLGRVNTLNESNLTGVVSGPLSERFGARAAFNYEKSFDGWQDGVNGSADAAKSDRLSGRVHLAYTPVDGIDTLFTLHAERDQGVNPSWHSDDRVGYDGFLGIQFSSPDQADRTDLGSFFTGVDGVRSPKNDTNLWGANFRISADTPVGELEAITGWQTIDRDAYDNNDGSPATLADFHFRTDVEQISQEIRLSSEFGNRGSLIMGLVYGRDFIDVTDDILATDTLNLLSPDGLRPSDFGIEVTQTATTRQITKSLGIYAHSEWYLSDALTLTLAGRYTDDERRFRGNVTDNSGYVVGGFGGVIVEVDSEESESDFSWRAGVDYQATENTLLYASVATGFKSGVFYSGAVPDPLGWGYVPPEQLTSYETGFKTRLKDRVQASAAVFHYQYEDKQSAIFIPTAFGPVSTLATLPESEATGAELEIAAQVSDSWDVSFGAAYLDAEVTKPPSDVRGIPVAAPVLKGDRLTQSPEFSLNAVSRYYYSLGDSYDGVFQLSYTYTSEMTQFLADPLSRSEKVSDMGLRLSIENKPKGWSLALFAQNLLDEDNKTFAYGNLLGNQTYARQRPRLVGLEFKVSM
ncbi:MAG: TonB-dependent receptor [Alphaproteobacteria bacterium]|nr:TonB-dependent receptor [Alphaproteobacteria bacterium]|tara:strand:- start:1574 stop:3793 length:2220 start_codon:yes stop_codon:yes gene_type:complete